MEPMIEDFSQFCAEGATCREEMLPASDNVWLRVVTFEPPIPSPYPKVVFVPGWITLPAAWKEVLLEMTKDFKIFYIETREKISSIVKGKVPYTVEALGNDIVRLVEYFGIKENEYILFGSSLGATVILDSIRFLKNKPRCAIVVGPNAVFRIPRAGKWVIHLTYPGFYALVKPLVKWYLRTFRLDVKTDFAQYKKYCDNLDAADPWKLKKAALAFSSYEIWPLLPEIKLPVCIIGASKDKLHEPENLKKMVALLPNATYMDFETNQGTHSKEMVYAVRKYLSEISH